MTRRLRPAFACVTVLAAFVVTRKAVAEARAPIDIVYDAPRECPARATFLTSVDARRAPDASRHVDLRTFHVRLVKDASGFEGSLEASGEPPHRRTVHARTCAEASRALAIALALALDAAAEDEPAAPEDAELTPPPGVVSTPREAPLSSPSPSPSPSALPPRARAPRLGLTWSSGVTFAFATLADGAASVRVHAELARASAVGPVYLSLRASFGWTDFAAYPTNAGHADFRTTTFRGEACARSPIGSLTPAACAVFDGGRLTAAVRDLPVSGFASTRWVAAGLALRLRWELVRGFGIEASATFLAPFTRRAFDLTDPARRVFRAPALLLEGGVGVSASADF